MKIFERHFHSPFLTYHSLLSPLLHLLWHHLMIRRKVGRVVKVTGGVYSPFFWCPRQTLKFTWVSQVGFPVENWSGVRHDFEGNLRRRWKTLNFTHTSFIWTAIFYSRGLCKKLHMNRYRCRRYPNLRCIPYSYRNNFPARSWERTRAKARKP